MQAHATSSASTLKSEVCRLQACLADPDMSAPGLLVEDNLYTCSTCMAHWHLRCAGLVGATSEGTQHWRPRCPSTCPSCYTEPAATSSTTSTVASQVSLDTDAADPPPQSRRRTHPVVRCVPQSCVEGGSPSVRFGEVPKKEKNKCYVVVCACA